MSRESLPPVAGPARRTVIAAVGAAGLAVALTACGSDDGSSDSANTQAGANASGGDSGAGGNASSGSGGTALAKTSDIPEGGGKVFSDHQVVVSQPKAGEFKAFTTICTHRQCPMTDLQDDILVCACHGSRFSVIDGSVKHGPALEPLGAKKITVDGDSITLA
ncbi:Rieske (2Fe-2S) protein [Streptomyces sp. NBC_01530]|uniref:Rieske (2Fe-2S) protein n=1 Tax=Streptomyces sp. NBC_01530 TaxID=2903895 RepID=UPI00386CEB83